MLFEDISYTEPDCLMCDDTGVIEDPESGKTYVCQFCAAYTNMVYEIPTTEEL